MQVRAVINCVGMFCKRLWKGYIFIVVACTRFLVHVFSSEESTSRARKARGMKFVGAHVSIGGGVFNAPLNAKAVGANAFALFTKNQQQWSAKPIEPQDAQQFKTALEQSGIGPQQVLAHDSYLINLGNPDNTKRERAYSAFLDELKRCEILGIQLLNIHPGSHVRAIAEDGCLNLIADCVNRAIAATESVTVVFENTAGQGSNVGYRFEHLANLIDRIKNKKRTGVCLDTCHTFASGYDIRTAKALKATLKEFDTVVGLTTLRGMHLNDSKHDLGSRKDRHECIGKGYIGQDAFAAIMQDERLDGIPLILETPDPDIYREEIALLRSFEKRKNP